MKKLAILAALCCLWGCGDSSDSDGPSVPQADPAETTFGVDNWDANSYVLVVTSYDPATEALPLHWPWVGGPSYQVVCAIAAGALPPSQITCQKSIALEPSSPGRQHVL